MNVTLEKEEVKTDQPELNEKVVKAMETTTCDRMDTLGFLCIGTAISVFGDTTEDENVWVWKHSNGSVVTMYDEGNDKVSFVAVIQNGSAKNKKTFRTKDF